MLAPPNGPSVTSESETDARTEERLRVIHDAMMEELGIDRRDALPLEDRDFGVPVHAVRTAAAVGAPSNPWQNAVFDDFDPEQGSLEDIAGGQLFRLRKDESNRESNSSGRGSRGARGARGGRGGRGDRGGRGGRGGLGRGVGGYSTFGSHNGGNHTRGGHRPPETQSFGAANRAVKNSARIEASIVRLREEKSQIHNPSGHQRNSALPAPYRPISLATPEQFLEHASFVSGPKASELKPAQVPQLPTEGLSSSKWANPKRELPLKSAQVPKLPTEGLSSSKWANPKRGLPLKSAQVPMLPTEGLSSSKWTNPTPGMPTYVQPAEELSASRWATPTNKAQGPATDEPEKPAELLPEKVIAASEAAAPDAIKRIVHKKGILVKFKRDDGPEEQGIMNAYQTTRQSPIKVEVVTSRVIFDQSIPANAGLTVNQGNITFQEHTLTGVRHLRIQFRLAHHAQGIYNMVSRDARRPSSLIPQKTGEVRDLAASPATQDQPETLPTISWDARDTKNTTSSQESKVLETTSLSRPSSEPIATEQSSASGTLIDFMQVDSQEQAQAESTSALHDLAGLNVDSDTVKFIYEIINAHFMDCFLEYVFKAIGRSEISLETVTLSTLLGSKAHVRTAEFLISNWFRQQSEAFALLTEEEEASYIADIGCKVLAKAFIVWQETTANTDTESGATPLALEAPAPTTSLIVPSSVLEGKSEMPPPIRSSTAHHVYTIDSLLNLRSGAVMMVQEIRSKDGSKIPKELCSRVPAFKSNPSIKSCQQLQSKVNDKEPVLLSFADSASQISKQSGQPAFSKSTMPVGPRQQLPSNKESTSLQSIDSANHAAKQASQPASLKLTTSVDARQQMSPSALKTEDNKSGPVSSKDWVTHHQSARFGPKPAPIVAVSKSSSPTSHSTGADSSNAKKELSTALCLKSSQDAKQSQETDVPLKSVVSTSVQGKLEASQSVTSKAIKTQSEIIKPIDFTGAPGLAASKWADSALDFKPTKAKSSAYSPATSSPMVQSPFPRMQPGYDYNGPFPLPTAFEPVYQTVIILDPITGEPREVTGMVKPNPSILPRPSTFNMITQAANAQMHFPSFPPRLDMYEHNIDASTGSSDTDGWCSPANTSSRGRTGNAEITIRSALPPTHKNEDMQTKILARLDHSISGRT